MTMSYVKLDLEDTDEVTARAMNHMETIADCALADLLTHDHDETYLSKTDADANYWSTDNGMDCNADTLQGSHASSLLGTGASLPIGTMVFWDGEIAAIPSGWQLANGSNGTLDMRNYFPAGSSSTHTIGTTFGAATTTVSGSIMIDPHALTIAEIPAHHHWIIEHYYAPATSEPGKFLSVYGTGSLDTYQLNPWTREGCVTESKGGGYAHDHVASWSASAMTNKPPWMGLYIIERIS